MKIVYVKPDDDSKDENKLYEISMDELLQSNISYLPDNWEKMEIQLVDDRLKDWKIKQDRDGIYMLYYRNIPAEEIIYAVGEISLALLTNITELQQEYYELGDGNIFNIGMKLIRDSEYAKEFHTIYKALSDKI